jgi:hypothetical protein
MSNLINNFNQKKNPSENFVLPILHYNFFVILFFGPFLGEGPEWPQALYGRVRSNKKKKKASK